MNLQAIVETTSAGVTPRRLPTGRRARTHPAIWADAPLITVCSPGCPVTLTGARRTAQAPPPCCRSSWYVVIDRKPFVAFYAGRGHRVLADGSYDALLDDMVTSGASWLVLEDYVVRQMRPQPRLSRLSFFLMSSGRESGVSITSR